MTGLEDLKDDEIATLRSEVSELTQQLHDANVQAAFWRRATEQAVTGWDALEDKIDQAVQILQKATGFGDVKAALAILVELSPLEPPTAELEAVLRELPEVDLGDGHKLRVVEEETPLKEK